jgi:hypothetical protein
MSKLPQKLKKMVRLLKKNLKENGRNPDADYRYIALTRVLGPFVKSLSCVSNLSF